MRLTIHRHDSGAVTVHADLISPRMTTDQLATALASVLLPPPHEPDPQTSSTPGVVPPTSSAPIEAAPTSTAQTSRAPALTEVADRGPGASAAQSRNSDEFRLRTRASRLFDQGLDDEAVCAALGISRPHLLRLDAPAADIGAVELDGTTAQLGATVGSPARAGAT